MTKGVWEDIADVVSKCPVTCGGLLCLFVPIALTALRLARSPEKHLGVPVKCHKCGQTFTVHPTTLASKPPSTEPIPPTAGTLRLDIAGVTSIGRERSRNEDSFLVQQLTWSDLNRITSSPL